MEPDERLRRAESDLASLLREKQRLDLIPRQTHQPRKPEQAAEYDRLLARLGNATREKELASKAVEDSKEKRPERTVDNYSFDELVQTRRLAQQKLEIAGRKGEGIDHHAMEIRDGMDKRIVKHPQFQGWSKTNSDEAATIKRSAEVLERKDAGKLEKERRDQLAMKEKDDERAKARQHLQKTTGSRHVNVLPDPKAKEWDTGKKDTNGNPEKARQQPDRYGNPQPSDEQLRAQARERLMQKTKASESHERDRRRER